MKKCSVHFIYIFLILVFLCFLTTESIKMIIDPTYEHRRYFARAPVWYFCIYLWYMCLTIAFRIQLKGDNSIKAFSILKRDHIYPDEIISIQDNFLSYTIIHSHGKTKVSNLIDGVKDIKSTIIGKSSSRASQIPKKVEKTMDQGIGFGKMLLKIFVVLFLIGFALFVELDHLSRIAK